jgi:hypothetical protein
MAVLYKTSYGCPIQTFAHKWSYGCPIPKYAFTWCYGCPMQKYAHKWRDKIYNQIYIANRYIISGSL